MNPDEKKAKQSIEARTKKNFYSTLIKHYLRRFFSYIVTNINLLLSKLPTQIRDASHVLHKYDDLAGSYVKQIKEAYDKPFDFYATVEGNETLIKSNIFFDKVNDYIIKEVFNIMPEAKSYIEVGAGELTTLARAVASLKQRPQRVSALEMSWSRLEIGRNFANGIGVELDDYMSGDLFNLPLSNNSFDVVYTHYALEQSPHRNNEAITELLRITKHYLILMEPAYELGNKEQKMNILKRDYIRGIPNTIKRMGFKLQKYELLPIGPYGNCPAIYVIKKDNVFDGSLKTNYKICPKSGEELMIKRQHLFANKAGILYPIINGIQCINIKNGIIASKY